jgi:ABC-2 type transport system permease protein
MATVLKKSAQVSRELPTSSILYKIKAILAGVFTLWFKHIYKFTHSSMEIVGTLGIPLLWMFLFGVCMDATLHQITGTGIGYKAYITPGVMFLTALTAAVMSGSTLLTERLNGVVKEYLVAPVPRIAVLFGTISSGLTKTVLQALIVLGLGALLDNALILEVGSLLAGLAIVVVYSLGFVGIAAAFACKAQEMEGYHSIIMLINLPVFFASNALYPLSKLPAALRMLAYLNPTTYAVDASRHLFYGVPTEIGLWLDISVLLIFALASLGYAYYTFGRLHIWAK